MDGMTSRELRMLQVISIMVCFFAMGSIEMVGIASNYIKVDLHISDAKANLLPSLVYVWFLVFTIPAGMEMCKIGRKRTVVLNMCIMALSMLMALCGMSYHYMVLCFILLGISNVSMQASLYPLLSNLISGKKLADNLTLGQFVKTLSSFSAPYVAMIGAIYLTHCFNLGWRAVFLFYFAVIVIATILLYASRIPNECETERMSSFLACFRLLKNPFILLSFIGIICHVGLDISTNTIAPKLLMYRCDYVLEKASFAASLYFIARLGGCFAWTFLLHRIPRKLFFVISVGCILVAMVTLFFAHSVALIFACIILIGIGNASLFPVLFAQAVVSEPDKKSLISTLMIMGQAGGALFPVSMGLAFDKVGLTGSIAVLSVAVAYLVFYTIWFKPAKTDA
jgi:fucose permease